jgi:hypothetical protein
MPTSCCCPLVDGQQRRIRITLSRAVSRPDIEMSAAAIREVQVVIRPIGPDNTPPAPLP